MRLKACKLVCLLCVLVCSNLLYAQDNEVLWHNKERKQRYEPLPFGTWFIKKDSIDNRRFNRALYGTNTGFRVEAGDLPEFALYLPGMGGNLKFGIIAGKESVWITEAKTIGTIYDPGSMIYTIEDPILGRWGRLIITVLALHDREGIIVRIQSKSIPRSMQLLAAYGGATGTRFSRDGDIGADPESSFDLKPEYCKDNVYTIADNTFSLGFGPKNNPRAIRGIFPATSALKLGDATEQDTPLSLSYSDTAGAPVLTAEMPLRDGEYFFVIVNGNAQSLPKHSELPALFEDAEAARKKLAGRIKLETPDPYLGTLGSALAVAADAIWEDPSYLHGAVAWRMRLNAWRGAYVADPLGWHDRARKHFSSYALSQVTTPPETGVVMDTALHLARHLEKIGTALFSDGYICRNPNGDIRAHHYDMNLVFVDQLLNHFNWTGDTAYVREMWPLIKRHLAWEKRNFDADGDGLYDAYAAIWASDALQYSGGGVTHTSAYNYRANKTAAMLAKLIGEDGSAYLQESDKILRATNQNLWLPDRGWYAEYKDLLGKKMVHPYAGLWTIYHSIDSKIADDFQAFQALRYVDTEIPHIPVRATGLKDTSMYLLSTSNWQPYTWSINNVALAENLHTALAYWQGGRNEEAYKLWRSTLLESMYLSASPGGFQQLSFYDAIRGELYRDFADGLGMVARTLVEGLFGVQPDALHDTLFIRPGLPREWEDASLQVPDIQVDYMRGENKEEYKIKQSFRKLLHLKLQVNAWKESVSSVTVNGKPVKWYTTKTVGKPALTISAPAAKEYNIIIQWKGKPISSALHGDVVNLGDSLRMLMHNMKGFAIHDPQSSVYSVDVQKEMNRDLGKKGGSLWSVTLNPANPGGKTFFLNAKQGDFEWYEPISFTIPSLLIDTTLVEYTYEKVALNRYFNDKVSNIFKQQYLSPRPTSPTLQLPTQGIGNWCYPLTTANISDSGLRVMAGPKSEIWSMDSVPFTTPSDTLLNNIIYTSQWDNYPDSFTIPLTGKASVVYLLMAGSTNPMQSRITNGMVTVQYADGTRDSLLLRNPENWWPIEQDYYDDGFAFTTDGHPQRLYFKEGKFARGLTKYSSIRGFSNRAIDGGAATVLHLPVYNNKTLQSLTVHSIANDVVIGLMAVTLAR